jgi:methyltransferase (TIGR00027 family)
MNKAPGSRLGRPQLGRLARARRNRPRPHYPLRVQEGRSSRTAEYMAMFRALETLRPGGLFQDRFAKGFLSGGLRAAVRLAALPGGLRRVESIIDRRWPGPRGAGVIRTRVIDDRMRAALTEGARQVVILGAGYDSRAYRIPGADRTITFEVDEPATQEAKRRRLRRMIREPEHVRFVPTDFVGERVADTLARAGFSPAAPAFFVWEGVTNYLTDEAVDAMLRFVASGSAAGSTMAMTYVHRGILDGTETFEGAAETIAQVRKHGEPFTFGFVPGELPGYLRARGLDLVGDVSLADAAGRYLGPARREMKVVGYYRVAQVRVR